MKKFLTPTWTINSVYYIKPSDLKKYNIDALIIDLDNTLIAWNQWEHTEEMAHWVRRMTEADVGIYLLSNNNYDRVLKATEPLALNFKSGALKPFRHSFSHAINELKVEHDKIVVVGDQIITDIIGANRSNLRSILVKPIAQNDNIYTKLNRQLEKIAFKIIGIDRKGDWGDTLE